LNDKISSISDKSYESEKVIDCSNLTVLPGVIDSQVHFREPGLEGKETLESGMLAAASGGVTSISSKCLIRILLLLHQKQLKIN
jgi:dihydroorotase